MRPSWKGIRLTGNLVTVKYQCHCNAQVFVLERF